MSLEDLCCTNSSHFVIKPTKCVTLPRRSEILRIRLHPEGRPWWRVEHAERRVSTTNDLAEDLLDIEKLNGDKSYTSAAADDRLQRRFI